MRNVVLVQPLVGDWDYMRSQPIPPLSLLSSVTLCASHYEIRWIDQRLSPGWEKDVAAAIDDKTLCVGTTAYTGPMIAHALEISEYVKRISSVPVVWGGVHASLIPVQTIMNPFIDFVVQGEGEKTFFDLLSALAQKKSARSVRGVWYKDDGMARFAGERELLEYDSLPPLPYHLVPMARYMPLFLGKKTFYYQSSRGCPYPCTYCYNSVFNRRHWRAKSSGKALAELRSIADMYAPEHIYIIDDIFFIDKKRSHAIVQGLKDLGVSWDLQGVDLISLDAMDHRDISALEGAGCARLSIGIESGSGRIRKLMKKKPEHPRDILRILDKFTNSSIILYCNYIAGTPTETDEDLKKTIDIMFALSARNPRIRFFPIYTYIPYPGTEMFDLAQREGFVPPASLEEWSRGEWGQIDGRSSINVPRGKPHTISFYRDLFLVSLLADRKLDEYTAPWMIKILSGLYRPIARWRMKNLFFHWFVERQLARGVLRAWNMWKKYYYGNTHARVLSADEKN